MHMPLMVQLLKCSSYTCCEEQTLTQDSHNRAMQCLTIICAQADRMTITKNLHIHSKMSYVLNCSAALPKHALKSFHNATG